MTIFPFSGISRPLVLRTLPNGLRYVVHSFPAPSVGLAVYVPAGPIVETPRNNGISHFLEHMVFRGTPRYPSASELSRALDTCGADFDAATYVDLVMFSLNVLPEAVESALELFAEMFQRPLFDNLEAERRIIIEECLEDLGEHGQVTAIDRLSSSQLYPGHPYSLPILGQVEQLKHITPARLRRHLHAYVRPERCVLSLSGGIKPVEAHRAMREAFGSWNPPGRPGKIYADRPVPEFRGPKFLFVPDSGSQVQIRLSIKTFPMTHPHYFVSEALARMLGNDSGSPLRERLQDREGLCYSLSAGLDGFEHAAAIHIDFSVHPDAAVKALKACLETLDSLRRVPIAASLVEHLRFQYVKGTRMAANDLWFISSRFALRHIFPASLSFPQEFRAFQRIGPEHLFQVAQSCFRRDRFALSVTGKVSPAAQKELQSLVRSF